MCSVFRRLCVAVDVGMIGTIFVILFGDGG